MILPMGLSIKQAYRETFLRTPFPSLLAQEKVRNQKLAKVQKYLYSVMTEKNEIFKKFIEKKLLSYDFMQIRDKQIREKFQEKYTKYSPKMYQLFYDRYIKETILENKDISI